MARAFAHNLSSCGRRYGAIFVRRKRERKKEPGRESRRWKKVVKDLASRLNRLVVSRHPSFVRSFSRFLSIDARVPSPFLSPSWTLSVVSLSSSRVSLPTLCTLQLSSATRAGNAGYLAGYLLKKGIHHVYVEIHGKRFSIWRQVAIHDISGVVFYRRFGREN